MIDFRYHLVSIIAVFMAVALGIVVGTTQLNDQVIDNLRGSIGSLTKDKRALESDVRTLQDERAAMDAFVEGGTGPLVRGALQGQDVLVVLAPDSSAPLADDLEELVAAAGGEVTGRLRLRPALFDPARQDALDDLVTRVRPRSFVLPTTDPAARAGALLAAALLRTPTAAGIGEGAAEVILGGFTGEDLVDLDRRRGAPARATAVVVMTSGAPDDEPDDEDVSRRTALLSVVRSLDEGGLGTVVAGPRDAASDGAVVAALRDDDTLADLVSTVDGADRAYGRVLTVLALAEQVRGVSGRYGSGSGAVAVVPTPSAAP